MEMYLQIENLNILVGAGCSSYKDDKSEERAIPTMKEMSEEFYKNNPDLLKIEIKGDKLVNDYVGTNLEALLSRLISIENAFDNERETTEKIKRRINEFIFKKVSADLSVELLNLYKQLYISIGKKSRKVPINVYTTNYDLYNETALDELDMMYNNGFLGSTKRKFNPNSYNYLLVENLNLNRDSWKSVSNFINLYKLHGSINWIKEENNIFEKDCDIVRGMLESVMIYPTPQKDRSTLMTPYSDLFRLMQNNLMRNNSVLITMGYSFSDDHINRVIFNALSVSDFRLIIFGDSEHIKQIAEKKSKNIWVINSKEKIHFFKNIVEKVLPPQDNDEKEKKAERDAQRNLFSLLNGKHDI